MPINGQCHSRIEVLHSNRNFDHFHPLLDFFSVICSSTARCFVFHAWYSMLILLRVESEHILDEEYHFEIELRRNMSY